MSPRPTMRPRHFFRPRLEVLESRLAPALLSAAPAPALPAFDAATGWLTLRDDQALVAFTNTGALAVTVDGQRYSSDPSDAAFAPTLAGANGFTLRGLGQTGDGTADTLTLQNLSVAGALDIQADGAVLVKGAVRSSGNLTVAAAVLTVNGSLSAAELRLTSTGLLNVADGGSLTAQAGGTIDAAANYLVNVGQIQVAGGSITLNAANVLNAGTLSDASTDGAGGNLRVGFTASYVDTASAVTMANGETTGGWLTVDGGSSGRLFSSGRLEANGNSGGRIDLFGQSIALVAATVSATGTAGQGGQLRIGGGYHDQDATASNAQTVEVTAATHLQADGTGVGGRVVVWSESQTDFTGSVSAAGTAAGGAIEVSSRGLLNYAGQANAGLGGQLLLDPANLVVSAAPTGVFPQFNLVNPQMDGTFGKQLLTLSTGNIVVTDPAAISNVGAVYLFNDTTGALLSTLTGATGGTNGDQVGLNGVTVLTNGNYVVDSSAWNGAPGAVTWGSGVVGVSGLVSASNSLVGSNASDHVGLSGVTALPNGNYVVASPNWNGNKGAATWGSGTLGVSGIVSATNSLVGSNANDYVGGLESNNGLTFPTGVQALANGNYVVASPNWNGTKGAATWGSGMVGVSGVVSATNSLVGATANDQVGADGVTTLTNNNYVVDSPNWNGGLGAVTWSSGTAGVMGTISASNSLVGTSVGSGPIVGDEVGSGGVTALTNGNYVVASQNWNGGEGAATWGNGATGVMGLVSATNSLVGSSAGDQVGYGVTALTNGHYVVDSPFWNGSKGAVTWGGGTLGVNGLVSATNSLVGTAVNDRVGYSGVTALTNGNYVVASPIWNGGKGAVTWGSGTLGVSGIVSATNSLVGSNANDYVGGLEIINGFAFPTGVQALANGNYIVASPNWNGNKGAATWGSGMVGVSGVVSATNSLVGATANDQVGADGVTTLTNGNYVVASPNWNGGLGAVTWSSGTAGVMGTLSASNSLVGSTAGDNVGGIPNGNNGFTNGVTALTNGNFVVVSPDWNGKKGAATWGNGAVAVSGMVSAANSLVGSNANDLVGYSGVTALTNGNYVVASPFWNGYKGAVTWGNGRVGSSGMVSATNSLVGSNASDFVGSTGTNGFTYPNGVLALANGNYVVASSNWNGTKGAATWGDGTNGTTLDGQNTIDLQNSLEGTVANAGLNTIQAGTFPGSFLASFTTENGGVIAVGVSDPNQVISALDQGQTLTVTPDFLTHSLNDGTAVTLQASNNITINTPINTSASNTTPLALQAGHGILLNAGINLGNGHLTLTAPTVTALANVTLTGNTLFLFANLSTSSSSLTAHFPTLYLNGASPRALVVTPTANQLTLNNQLLNLSGVTTLDATGGAGDHALLNDTAGTDVFTATPTYSSLQGSGVTVIVHGYGSVQANSSHGGNDTAIFSTTTGADSFVGTPTYSQVTGSNYTNTAVGFAHVHGYAGGPSAIAYMVTSSANGDILGGIPAYSFVQSASDSYDSYAIGFAQVDGYSGGASSIAYLGMSSGHDTFFGLPSYSAVTGTGYAVYAVGFHQSQGYSGGPNSTAILETSAGSDTYVGTPSYSSVQGASYLAYALGFATVDAYSGGSNSVAYLTTSSGNDNYVRALNYSEATGSGYTNFALGFANVGVTAGSSNSVATFYDAPGNNTFTGSGSSAMEAGPGYGVNDSSFGTVVLHGNQGGTDHFIVSNITYTFTHDGNWQ